MKEWGKAQLFVVVGSGSGMSREGAEKQYECVGNHQANGAGKGKVLAIGLVLPAILRNRIKLWTGQC